MSATTYEELSTDLDAQIRARAEAQSELLRENPSLRVAERERAMRETLRAKRGAISALLGDGVISEQVHDELVADVDAALAGDEPLETE